MERWPAASCLPSDGMIIGDLSEGDSQLELDLGRIAGCFLAPSDNPVKGSWKLEITLI